MFTPNADFTEATNAAFAALDQAITDLAVRVSVLETPAATEVTPPAVVTATADTTADTTV